MFLVNALETTVPQRPFALQIFLQAQDDPSETRFKYGSFSPQTRPPRGTTEWYICHYFIAQPL